MSLLILLVVGCSDKETEEKITMLENRITELEKKQDRLIMFSEINNGFDCTYCLWTFINEANIGIDGVLNIVDYPITFNEFLELEEDEYKLIFEDIKYRGKIKRIGK